MSLTSPRLLEWIAKHYETHHTTQVRNWKTAVKSIMNDENRPYGILSRNLTDSDTTEKMLNYWCAKTDKAESTKVNYTKWFNEALAACLNEVLIPEPAADETEDLDTDDANLVDYYHNAPPTQVELYQHEPFQAIIEVKPDMVTVDVPIRPGITASLSLPDDLTAKEASRIARIVDAFPHDS